MDFRMGAGESGSACASFSNLKTSHSCKSSMLTHLSSAL